MSLTISFIGTGNLGKTLGRLIIKNKLATILGIFNRTPSHSIQAMQFIEDGEIYHDITALPHSEIIFITTPDDAISEAGLLLSQNQHIKPGCIIVHCSGSLTSDILLPMKQLGCYVASIHPMRSFAKPEISVEQYKGTYCAIEGDKEATDIITQLFNAIGSVTYFINKDKKLIYHASGIFASNYLVTLAQQSLSCLLDAGVEKEMAMEVLVNIMKGTILNLEKTKSPEQSLTGPIQRGDLSTIKKHLNAFSDSKQQELYAALGQATLGITHHDEQTLDELHNIFNAFL